MSQTALITGASSGIGKELAIQFAKGGDDVALVARSEDKLHELAERIRKDHSVAVHITCLEPGATESNFGDDSGMGKLDMFASSAMTSKAVAKAGYQGYCNNEDIVIPGWKNRLMVTTTSFLPRFAMRKIVGKMQGNS